MSQAFHARVTLSDVLDRDWWQRQSDEWIVELQRPGERSVDPQVSPQE